MQSGPPRASALRLVADEAIPWLREALGGLSGVTLETVPSERLPDAMRLADAALVRTVTRVDASLLAACTNLCFVGTASAGFDHLDVETLASRGIAWAHAPGCNADAVADWVVTAWSMLERSTRQDPPAAVASGSHVPEPSSRRRVAVVGLGQTGARVAARLASLGHDVVAIDPVLVATSQDRWPTLADPDAEHLRRHTRLWPKIDAKAHGPVDAITLHVPLVHGGPHATHRLLDVAAWRRLGAPRWCINASRGEVLDAEALVEAAWRAGDAPELRLALDVWPREPALPLSWLSDPRLVLATPHIAGYGARSKWNATAAMRAALVRHFKLATSSFTPTHRDVHYEVHVRGDRAFATSPAMPAAGGEGHGHAFAADTRSPSTALTSRDVVLDVLHAALGLDPLDRALRSVVATQPLDGGAAHFQQLRRSVVPRPELADVHVRVVPEATTATSTRTAEALTVRLRALGVTID